jgi:ubiquilin
MGAPPSEEEVASMLDNPNAQQMMNEALQNPQIIDMIIQQTPHLRNNPQARQMLQSPEFRYAKLTKFLAVSNSCYSKILTYYFRRMMTDPAALRQAASMQRMMRSMGGGADGFPAPGVTDTTPGGATGTTPGAAGQANPFGNMFGAGANPFANPFASPFPPSGATPAATPPAPGSAGQTTPGQTGTPGTDGAAAANPFASLFGGPGAANPFAGMPGLPAMTPQQMQEAMAAFAPGGLFAGASPFGAAGIYFHTPSL